MREIPVVIPDFSNSETWPASTPILPEQLLFSFQLSTRQNIVAVKLAGKLAPCPLMAQQEGTFHACGMAGIAILSESGCDWTRFRLSQLY